MEKTKRLTRLALLTAAASVIFIVELQMPNLIPIAGVKAGLSNIVAVYALYRYKWQDSVLITLCRIIIGTLFSSNFSAILYSISGAVLCLLAMILLRKTIPEKYIWLTSAIGGIIHNMGQLLMAVIISGSFSVLSYLPVLICTGCIAGAFTGLCAGFLNSRKIPEK